MIFTALGGVFTLALGYVLVGSFTQQENGDFFKVVSVKSMRQAQENIRRRKLVVTSEEMKKVDPTFVMPSIQCVGEADI